MAYVNIVNNKRENTTNQRTKYLTDRWLGAQLKIKKPKLCMEGYSKDVR